MNEQERALIEDHIKNQSIEESIDYLTHQLSIVSDNEPIYLLLGKAYQKQTNWHEALNHYQYAIDINPNSPAVQLREMVMQILEFFNKDMFNQ